MTNIDDDRGARAESGEEAADAIEGEWGAVVVAKDATRVGAADHGAVDVDIADLAGNATKIGNEHGRLDGGRSGGSIINLLVAGIGRIRGDRASGIVATVVGVVATALLLPVRRLLLLLPLAGGRIKEANAEPLPSMVRGPP